MNAFAQKGTVSGTITDKDLNNEPLPFASVSLKGTTTGASTDIDGKYSLTANPGSYTLTISFVGYEPVEVPVTVKSNETVTVDRALGSGSVTLQDVQVQQAVNRQKESALLLEQKNAVEIKQNIGAQELSRKGVTDVATAVTKTSGITKQEGSGNIYVRGLGDRYNSTTLNGLPIPSNDAEKKNITLEIFPTEIVEYVSIDKVYNNRIYGDFAGGNVDIISKEQKGTDYLRFDLGSNINTNAINEEHFTLSPRPNTFGFSSIKQPASPLTKYNYETLSLEEKTPFGGSIGVSGGKSFAVGTEGKLTVFGTAAFGNEFLSIADGQSYGDINGAGFVSKRYDDYRSFSYGTNTTGMANVTYKMNPKHKFKFNSLFINTSNLETEEYRGYSVDWAEEGNGFIRRNTYTRTSLFINQLLGEHTITDRLKFNWAGGFNLVNDSQPDRTTNRMNIVPGGVVINSVSAPNNNRYFQDIDEDELNALLSVDYKFGKTADEDFEGKLTLGYNGRVKNRRLEATQFNFDTNPLHTGDVVDPDNLDAFYNEANLSAGYFDISTFRGTIGVPNVLDPQFYEGELMVNAGFAAAEYRFSDKFTAVAGLRAEVLTQDVSWSTTLDPAGDSNKLEKTAILPNLTMRYALNEKQNLRFAFSKTYTLPQFKERALFVYEDVTQAKVGNPDLYESDDYNVDLKWELFPKQDEVVSVTAFGKFIQNPINEVIIASSTNDISWLNTGDNATVFGAEIEYRKLLYGTTDNGTKLSAGVNASYLHTDQELDADKVRDETNYDVQFTNSKSAFTGASDLLVNADVSYFREWNEKKNNVMATIAYNYFSDRLYSIGINERGDLVDKAVGTLDFILKSKLGERLGIGVSAKNILNPTIERVQENKGGDVLAQSYKKGVNFGISLNYQF